jgi:hypothetical protein
MIARGCFLPRRRLFAQGQPTIYRRMTSFAETSKRAYFWFRLLTMFCIALTLSLSLSSVVTANQNVHHEQDIVRAGSGVATIFCLGNDQSCGLPDHDENKVVPHLHATDAGLFGLPAIEAVKTVNPLVSVGFPLSRCENLDGIEQQALERPPRATCI